jgi:hypothetical protein
MNGRNFELALKEILKRFDDDTTYSTRAWQDFGLGPSSDILKSITFWKLDCFCPQVQALEAHALWGLVRKGKHQSQYLPHFCLEVETHPVPETPCSLQQSTTNNVHNSVIPRNYEASHLSVSYTLLTTPPAWIRLLKGWATLTLALRPTSIYCT